MLTVTDVAEIERKRLASPSLLLLHSLVHSHPASLTKLDCCICSRQIQVFDSSSRQNGLLLSSKHNATNALLIIWPKSLDRVVPYPNLYHSLPHSVEKRVTTSCLQRFPWQMLVTKSLTLPTHIVVSHPQPSSTTERMKLGSHGGYGSRLRHDPILTPANCKSS
jgi:hypothetical protein